MGYKKTVSEKFQTKLKHVLAENSATDVKKKDMFKLSLKFF